MIESLCHRCHKKQRVCSEGKEVLDRVLFVFTVAETVTRRLINGRRRERQVQGTTHCNSVRFSVELTVRFHLNGSVQTHSDALKRIWKICVNIKRFGLSKSNDVSVCRVQSSVDLFMSLISRNALTSDAIHVGGHRVNLKEFSSTLHKEHSFKAKITLMIHAVLFVNIRRVEQHTK